MRLLKFRFAIPAGSFLLAVGLSWLCGGAVRPVLARQSTGTTTCTGSATAVSVTVAAGSGIKKGTPGWTFSITDQPVNLVNSKTASLIVTDTLSIDVDDVVATDSDHKRHPFGTQTLTVDYLPVLVLEKNNLQPEGSSHNAIPATITLAGIDDKLFKSVANLLPGVKITKVTGNLNAQATFTHQFISAVCGDGTDLPTFPRPDTKLSVDGKGNAKPVKN
jgi:hypothetical protein